MPVHITFHVVGSALGPMVPSPHGGGLPILGAKIGNSNAVAVGTVANTSAVTNNCVARIEATEAARIEIGVGATAHATNSEYWPAGRSEHRFVPAGGRVSVIAP